MNRNSGAESTIHGLLTMLILDENPATSPISPRSPTSTSRRTWTLVEAESGGLGSGASAPPAERLDRGEPVERRRVRDRRQARWHADDLLRWRRAGPNLLMPVVLLDPSAGDDVDDAASGGGRRRPLECRAAG